MISKYAKTVLLFRVNKHFPRFTYYIINTYLYIIINYKSYSIFVLVMYITHIIHSKHVINL